MEQAKPQQIRNILWTVNEAATVFGVQPRTVRWWIINGRIESIKVGVNRLIPHRAIHDYFAEALANPDTREATIELLNAHAATLGKPALTFDELTTDAAPLAVETATA